MTSAHPITAEWDDIPDDADDLALVGGGYRAYACGCGHPLDGREAAEEHAASTGQCSVCLGAAEEEIVPGFARPCTGCAGSGRRGAQLVWELAHAEARTKITTALVRAVIRRFDGPFALSQAADAVRDTLGLRPGRLPVGPRVRDVLRALDAAGELELLSAPDELLRGPGVVLYRDPLWRRTGRA